MTRISRSVQNIRLKKNNSSFSFISTAGKRPRLVTSLATFLYHTFFNTVAWKAAHIKYVKDQNNKFELRFINTLIDSLDIHIIIIFHSPTFILCFALSFHYGKIWTAKDSDSLLEQHFVEVLLSFNTIIVKEKCSDLSVHS